MHLKMRFHVRPMWFTVEGFMRYADVEHLHALRLLQSFRCEQRPGPSGAMEMQWRVYVVVLE